MHAARPLKPFAIPGKAYASTYPGLLGAQCKYLVNVSGPKPSSLLSNDLESSRETVRHHVASNLNARNYLRVLLSRELVVNGYYAVQAQSHLTQQPQNIPILAQDLGILLLDGREMIEQVRGPGRFHRRPGVVDFLFLWRHARGWAVPVHCRVGAYLGDAAAGVLAADAAVAWGSFLGAGIGVDIGVSAGAGVGVGMGVSVGIEGKIRVVGIVIGF
ncbi:hypothetical protein BDP27DRAFT_1409386 [Rhodocollybia butyracea]|uniref:Uncharacterized protein n=1 Tax=Rhodocollybia butyracea TaxID=206335 RepID=A0A9P5P5D2_9AGAR|nr:hypothetical protein BDP27DRAFT_1409386 [Rhodocollybia butyracea]